MTTLYLSHRVPYPPNKGEKIRTYHQIRHLVDEGRELVVCAPAERATDRADADALARELGIQVVTEPLPPGLWRKLRALATGQPISVSHFYSRPLQRRLECLLAEARIDTVVCTSSAMARYLFRSPRAAQLTERGALRRVMDFMDLDSDKWRQYQRASSGPMRWVYGREARLLERVERAVHQRFDACLFISAAEVELFARRLGSRERLHVCANGLDTRQFRPSGKDSGERKEGPVLLFTGVMNYRPNEDAVLWFAEAVWPELRRRWPTARFVIAGMDPSTRVRALTRLPGVEVTGFVDDILPYYHQADLFVAPFRLARGVQNKILQAFACGVPVVSTRLGAEGIDCRGGEHLAIADDAAGMLAAIDALLAQPTRARAQAEAALGLVRERYSWSGRLAGLVELTGGAPAGARA